MTEKFGRGARLAISEGGWIETKTVTLSAGGRTCEIHIGAGLLDGVGCLLSELGSERRFAVVTNPTVNAILGARLSAAMREAGIGHSFFEIPDSESAKSMEVAGAIHEKLSKGGFDRESCVVGLGGGVVGDLAGFAAATYMRGVGLVQMPTTLTAQVDSAIGGKTGLNLPGGKNMVGAFHQPLMVVSDVTALHTLPEREFRSGLAEVVKYGVLAHGDMFTRMEKGMQGILSRDPVALESLVAECSELKARIVEKDERDEGIRRTLNLGHTLGHALETATLYKRYSHGEAVSVGLVYASVISHKLGRMPECDLRRIENFLTSVGLPVRIEGGLDAGVLLGIMKGDKKASHGRLRLVLPDGIGGIATVQEVDDATARSAIEGMMK